MKGVLLAGGTGSRLLPLTKVTNKHLLPIGGKPMIYYPLNNLIQAGIKDIYVVTGGEHYAAITGLLGSGKKLKENLGINAEVSLSFGTQDRAGGIAEALGLARTWAGNDNVVVMLGDNIYENERFLEEPVRNFRSGAHIFLKEIPEQYLYEIDGTGKRKAKYGMAAFNGCEEMAERILSDIEEKPEHPATNYAVTGAYIYDNNVFEIINGLKPSGRGELEITDVNNAYLKQERMNNSFVEGYWTDAGSHSTLQRANMLEMMRQARNGDKTLSTILEEANNTFSK